MATPPPTPPMPPPAKRPLAAPPAMPGISPSAGGPPLPPGAKPLPAGSKVIAGAAGAPGAATAPGEEEPAAVQLSFWQLPWVQNVLPFVTSLTLHATIIVIAILTIKVIQVIKSEPPQDQIIIPDSTMADSGPPGGVPNVGLGDDANKKAAQDTDPDSTTNDWANKKGPSVDIAQAGGASGDSSDSVIGLGPGGGFGSKGHSVGGAAGDGSGSGNGDGAGSLARFGSPGGGAIGPKGPVFGHGGNAKLITFVCDASGSMINKMASLKNQLSNAVQNLKASQGFGIIFFQDEKYTSLNTALLPATPENKRKAAKYLEDITTTGTTNPIPGIELAFKQHPQLIYLLTDGDFPDNKAVLDKIHDLEKTQKVKINTIAFVSSTDTDTAFYTLLQQISTDTGGVFRKVDEEKLDNN